MAVFRNLSLYSRDVRLLFSTRILRMFAYGLLSVILVLYLSEAGLSTSKIGLLLTLTLLGDTIISLGMTTTADRIGRRKMLIGGAILMVMAGLVFALTRNFALLLATAIIGVISPSGNEVGPFLSIEQAALSQLVADEKRTHVFAWYNLAGSFAMALGALAGGASAQWLGSIGFTSLTAYRVVVMGYGVMGLALSFLFLQLSKTIEVAPDPGPTVRKIPLGLHASRNVVFKLSALFTIDSFAGGLIMQSFLAYWFHVKFDVEVGVLGGVFFAANLLAGVSALSAARIAARIGFIPTMVFTHLPSNVLLILIPLMPNAVLAIGMLFLRFAIGQMDVPARQAYTMSVVPPDERSAAAGVTGIARTIGAGLSPVVAGPLFASASLLSLPFFLAGGLKIVYDLMLYRNFKAARGSGDFNGQQGP